MMTQEFPLWLQKNNACAEGLDWTGTKDLSNVWRTCPRADWLLWIAQQKLIEGVPGWPSHEELARVAILCAEQMFVDPNCLHSEGTLRHAQSYQVLKTERYAPLVFDERRVARGEFGYMYALAEIVRRELKVPI